MSELRTIAIVSTLAVVTSAVAAFASPAGFQPNVAYSIPHENAEADRHTVNHTEEHAQEIKERRERRKAERERRRQERAERRQERRLRGGGSFGR
ncbi:MAG: hypothetical protein QNJ29_07250 [Rhizobiaceae bacterium]|nr:hypothetical protein [Rhizobiaceae bacterium]